MTSGYERDGKSVVRNSLEDEEVSWINSATWNDSLWVESNYSLELNESGRFYSQETASRDSLNLEHSSCETGDKDGGRCDQQVCSKLEDIEYISTDEDSDGCLCCYTNMYENFTDDIKLTLVNTALNQKDTGIKRCKTAPANTMSTPVKECCSHKYTHRNKHDYLRRSSPSSSLPSISPTSSISSLTSAVSRQSRSVSPLLRRAVEAHQLDVSRSKVGRRCCSNDSHSTETSTSRNSTRPLQRKTIPSSSLLQSTCNSRARSSPHKTLSPKSSRGALDDFPSCARLSRSLSPLVTVADTRAKKPQHHKSRNMLTNNSHQKTAPVSRSLFTDLHSPRARSLKSTPASSRSNSACSLTPPVTRRRRSLSPQLVHSIEAHQADVSKMPSYRGCCNNKNFGVSEQVIASTPKLKKSIRGSSARTKVETTASKETFSRAQSSPPNLTKRLNDKNSITRPKADKLSSPRCKRPCCQQQYVSLPKFDYLRKGGGVKKPVYTPTTKSCEKQSSLQKPSRHSYSCGDNVRASPTFNCSNNNNTIIDLKSRPRKSVSRISVNSSQPHSNHSLPTRITLKHPSLDESDSGVNGSRNAVVCDEVLLEFPSLYYKLDCSGEAGDVDLESRKAKTGTVYRILDDGSVVRECDLDGNEDQVKISGKL